MFLPFYRWVNFFRNFKMWHGSRAIAHSTAGPIVSSSCPGWTGFPCPTPFKPALWDRIYYVFVCWCIYKQNVKVLHRSTLFLPGRTKKRWFNFEKHSPGKGLGDMRGGRGRGEDGTSDNFTRLLNPGNYVWRQIPILAPFIFQVLSS